MEGRLIRETFLRFFEERGHKRVPSSSLIPPPESGLLLTTAGMVQFIPYFLGLAEPPFGRATTVQKSFRTTDIDLVGHTARHLTMFEMLGNFSFGDYFKKESCAWGYELVTEGFGVDPDRLWVTVYETDDEAIDIWVDKVGMPRERVVRRGKDDNFWWTHRAGPGGPCSEIYVDRGPKYGDEGGPAVDEERFMEVWNHVFMQNQVDDDGEVVGELPRKNIDTGASIERFATVLGDLDSFYETDLMRPLVEVAESLAGKRYGRDERTDVSLRIVAEHGRATTLLMADGVQPSNEGRGYVLRRMLRRLVSRARLLGVEGPVMERLVDATVETLGDAYPELHENRAFVLQVAASEEDRFSGTLRQGMELFRQASARTPTAGRLSGDDAFKLHDTFGFPRELTEELAADEGLEIDLDRFDELMSEQRLRAREAAKRGKLGEELGSAVADVGATEFVGYERLEADSRVAALFAEGAPVATAGEGEEVRVLLPVSPFYAESGGQIGDHGVIRTPGGLILVTDAQWAPGDAIVHTGVIRSGEIRVGEDAHAEVDAGRRESTARSHTATHIVHWTLKHLLGEHARQAGSLVEPGSLRFDFPHHSAVSQDLLEEAEEVANGRLARDDAPNIFHTDMQEAKRLGAVALFDEKYGDLVRVVEIGDYSRELCGGTHVARTGQIALVRILHEASIGAGMRRIEALVGPDALREVNLERRLLVEMLEALKAGDPKAGPERARQVMQELRQLHGELAKIQKGDLASKVEDVVGRKRVVAGVNLVASLEEGIGADALRELAQKAVNRLEDNGGAAVVLGNRDGGKALIVAAVSKGLVARGVTAQRLLEAAAKQVGGGAGGKPILGFAGGPKGEAVQDAIQSIPGRLEELLAEAGG